MSLTHWDNVSVDKNIHVVVVGGGMAGLAACEHLIKCGLNVVLVEANNYLGEYCLLLLVNLIT
mgnify:FL=1